MNLEVTERYGKALSPAGLRPKDAPDWIHEVDNPYIHGNFAPITAETSADNLKVEGEIPRDLVGGYYRNGSNPRYKPKHRYHWFDGDGMVHGIRFQDGKAKYANKYIQTKALGMETEKGEAIWPGVLGPFDFSLPISPIKDTGNTDLVYFNRKLLALWYESGAAYDIDPFTLRTNGIETFGDKLTIPISAHSKVDPNTGDLIFFNYGDKPPYMRYGTVTAAGEIRQTVIDLPGARRPHDIGVTSNYSILHDFPIYHDPEYFKRTGKRVPYFHPETPTRYGVIPRFGRGDEIKWFECEPCYMLHTVNCWEEGDWVVMLGCRTANPVLRPDRQDGELASMLSALKLQANLHSWRFNMKTGEVREGDIDDLNAEFPMINVNYLGRENRYSYHQHIPYEIPATFDALIKYDLESGAYQRYDYGPGVFGSETPFAPRQAAESEDDGYLVAFVTDTKDWSSACWIFDARDIESGPVAKVRLPRRVPAGFHAVWVPGEELFRS